MSVVLYSSSQILDVVDWRLRGRLDRADLLGLLDLLQSVLDEEECEHDETLMDAPTASSNCSYVPCPELGRHRPQECWLCYGDLVIRPALAARDGVRRTLRL